MSASSYFANLRKYARYLKKEKKSISRSEIIQGSKNNSWLMLKKNRNFWERLTTSSLCQMTLTSNRWVATIRGKVGQTRTYQSRKLYWTNEIVKKIIPHFSYLSIFIPILLHNLQIRDNTPPTIKFNYSITRTKKFILPFFQTKFTSFNPLHSEPL